MSGEIKLKGGSVQHFMTGDLYWTAGGGAHKVHMEYTWKKNGGLTGKLGFPTSDLTRNGSKGWYQKFQGGTIYQNTKGAEKVVFTNK